MPGKVVPLLEGKAALVRPEVPRAVQRDMAMSLSEPGDITELQHEVAVAELEYEAAAAELTKAPRLEVPMLSHTVVVELEHEAAGVELTEAPRLEVAVLAEDALAMKLETMVRPMKLWTSVWREMAEVEAAISGFSRLRRRRNRREHCGQYHDPAHRLAPWSAPALLLNLVRYGSPDTFAVGTERAPIGQAAT